MKIETGVIRFYLELGCNKERGAKLASSTRPIVHRHCVSLYIGVIHQKITQKSQKSSQNNKNVSHECSY
jgi:hypothetical protein